MKMKTGTRIIFSIYIILIMAIGVLIILAAFNKDIYNTLELMILHLGTFTFFTVVWIAAAALFIIVGLCLLFFGFGKSEEKQSGVVLNIPDGTVSVALPAIDELSRRYLSTVEGVIINSVKVKSNAEGAVALDVDISCKPGVVMPTVTEKITAELKKYVEQFSGVTVSGTNLRITPTKAAAVPVVTA